MTDQINGSADNVDASSIKDKSQDTVKYETYQRVLSEAKNAKERLKILEAEKQETYEKSLKEQNEYKLLWEQSEKTKKEIGIEHAELKGLINKSIKVAAFQKFIGGKVKNDRYLDFANIEGIIIDPETGKVVEESAKLVAAEYMRDHSALIDLRTAKMPNESATEFRIGNKPVSEMTSEQIENELRKFK